MNSPAPLTFSLLLIGIGGVELALVHIVSPTLGGKCQIGAVAGPRIARFRFGDRNGVNDLQPFGRQVCPEFTEPVDLEGKATTINFDLPLKK